MKLRLHVVALCGAALALCACSSTSVRGECTGTYTQINSADRYAAPTNAPSTHEKGGER